MRLTFADLCFAAGNDIKCVNTYVCDCDVFVLMLHVVSRCNDLESAGIAFKALHGWWFDGRLVTVKYLREQRYEERYPDSQGASTTILPSNNSRLSLSHPFHSSIIENS